MPVLRSAPIGGAVIGVLHPSAKLTRSLTSLLATGEGETVEFKASARRDRRAGKISRESPNDDTDRKTRAARLAATFTRETS